MRAKEPTTPEKPHHNPTPQKDHPYQSTHQMEQGQEQGTTKSDTRPVQDLAAAKHQENAEEALIDAALACVRWDESVDLGRLVVLEFEHNFGLLAPAVVKAGRRLDRRNSQVGSGWYVGPRTVTVHFLWAPRDQRSARGDSVVLYRHDDGTWGVESDGERMTDARLAAWLAICARLSTFSFLYTVYDGDVDPDGVLRFDVGDMPSFKDTWTVSVVEALAVRSGAWTGAEIMRTRNLCVALSAILDVRKKGGLLAVVDVLKSGALDQAVAPALSAFGPGKGAVSSSMRDALRVAESLAKRGFTPATASIMHEMANAPSATVRKILDTVYRMVDRLYATDAYFLKLIGPAEYEAMATDAPLAATFFH